MSGARLTPEEVRELEDLGYKVQLNVHQDHIARPSYEATNFNDALCELALVRAMGADRAAYLDAVAKLGTPSEARGCRKEWVHSYGELRLRDERDRLALSFDRDLIPW